MIYLSYGVTKSATTYLYQLTEEVFRSARGGAARLGPPFHRPLSPDNYLDVIDATTLDAIAGQIGEGSIVLKTHGTLDPSVADAIDEGRILASAAIRDPREIALSMLDHGLRSRRWHISEFSECVKVVDTVPAIDAQIERFNAWAACPGVAVFTYNEICFETATVVHAIARQIGAAVDPAAILAPFRNKSAIGQFSKGAPLRSKEMAAADQRMMITRYASLYDTIEFETRAARQVARQQDTAALKPRGQLRQTFTQLRRQWRRRARSRYAPEM